MMKLLHINIIQTVIFFITVKNIIGDQRFVAFEEYFHYQYPENQGKSMEIFEVSENFEVKFTEESIINTYPGYKKSKIFHAKASIKLNCELHIYFDLGQGIHLCQNSDGEYNLITTDNVFHGWTPEYHDWRVSCDHSIANIIEGKEIQISCQVAPTANSSAGEITIGWIQGERYIAQPYNLNKDIINIYQNFKFNSGEAIFFYCLKTLTNNRCYTLTLSVLPQLKVTVKPASRPPRIPSQRCFRCQATRDADDKVYSWNLHNSPMKFNDEHKSKICIDKLTPGVYTIECLVSTNAQNSSDVLEFTVNEFMPIEKTIQQTANLIQDDVDGQNNHTITVTILTTTITILVFVVLILVYILMKETRKTKLADSDE